MKIKTKKLSAIVPHNSIFEPNVLQIGYLLNNNWIGVHNIYRTKGGWTSDKLIGKYKTITEWKEHTKFTLGVK